MEQLGSGGGRLEALRAELKEQVRVLVTEEKIANAHPYLGAWLTCRKLQGPSETRFLPDEGGALDQDYMLTWAFEIIDNAYAEEQELRRNLKEKLAEREQLRQTLLAKMRT